jgi:hypothetical protein
MNPYHSQTLFGFWLMLAKAGLFKHSGLIAMEPKHWPQGRVLYPEGLWSKSMCLGNAVEYAELYGGKVYHPHDKAARLAARLNSRRGLS